MKDLSEFVKPKNVTNLTLAQHYTDISCGRVNTEKPRNGVDKVAKAIAKAGVNVFDFFSEHGSLAELHLAGVSETTMALLEDICAVLFQGESLDSLRVKGHIQLENRYAVPDLIEETRAEFAEGKHSYDEDYDPEDPYNRERSKGDGRDYDGNPIPLDELLFS